MIRFQYEPYARRVPALTAADTTATPEVGRDDTAAAATGRIATGGCRDEGVVTLDPDARRDIEAFYQNRFPAGYSAISTDLARIASESGVNVSSEKYDQKESDVQSLQRVEVEAEVSGDYLPLVKFINTLERSKVFFIIDDLELGGQASGSVKLRIKLETYLRTT